MTRPLRPIPLLIALAATACTQPSPPSPQAVKPSLPPPDTAAAVRTIRAAGDGLDSAVQVQPLRDPAIDGYLARARAAEKANDFAAAAAAAASALKLAPDAPDLLQYQAEIEVERGQWLDAEKLAIGSFTLGPKVGSLCARNWQTVVEARTALNDPATVGQAKLRLKECRVPPRLRM